MGEQFRIYYVYGGTVYNILSILRSSLEYRLYVKTSWEQQPRLYTLVGTAT